MKIIHWLFCVLVLGLYLGIVVMVGGDLLHFWDIPSFVVTVVFCLMLLLGHYTPAEMIQAFRCAGTAEADEADLRRALNFFEVLHRLVVVSGILGFMVGFTMILVTYPSDNFNRELGRFMAVNILTVTYSLVFIMLVTIPYQSAIKKKLIR